MNAPSYIADSARLMRIALCPVLLALVLGAQAASGATVSFTDVAAEVGVNSKGPTAASAWGDANADGWPDLWVSNHHGHAPHLYLSQQQSDLNASDAAPAKSSRFIDAASSLSIYNEFKEQTWPDFHGAAWADYDNDGDQDIVVLTGAGAGRGSSSNYLFQSIDGNFVEQAVSAGIDYPRGRGRTPLWLDANADGALDLLVMNKPRQDAPSRLFLQTAADHRFAAESSFESLPGWWSSFATWATEALGLGRPPLVAATEFAQLLPIDNRLAVLTWGKQTELRGLQAADYARLEMPEHEAIGGIQDAALADFNGDGLFDWFLLRAQSFKSDIKEINDRELHAVLNGEPDKTASLIIAADGDLELHVHRPWMDPSDPHSKDPLLLNVGGKPRATNATVLHFTREEASSESIELASGVLSIAWLDATKSWQIANTLGPLNIIAMTGSARSSWKVQGFKPSKGAASSTLLIASARTNNETNPATGLPDKLTSKALPKWPCQSVTAADFDNDTDVDLFLVCTNPVDDVADLLLENDGEGNFRVHEQPKQPGGRGNQVSAADFDRDGFIDLAVTNGNGAPPFADAGVLQLLKNNGNSNAWLELDLVGSRSNRDGLGAIVTLTSGGKQQVRLQGGGMHNFSQDHSRLHFGLGNSERVDTLKIRWPSGSVQILRDIMARQILRVEEADAP